jgi:hypothetical protein
MVLVLFSVTFFTETNQKRIRESLSFIRAISATSMAVSLRSHCDPHRTQCECWCVVYTVPNHGYGTISFKRALLIYFLGKPPNTFDTDASLHNELLFHYPREHYIDIRLVIALW